MVRLPGLKPLDVEATESRHQRYGARTCFPGCVFCPRCLGSARCSRIGDKNAGLTGIVALSGAECLDGRFRANVRQFGRESSRFVWYQTRERGIVLDMSRAY